MKNTLTLLLLIFSGILSAQIKAFPEAEGAGAYTYGGRYGDVYHVTNLNNSGTGSLRDAINTAPTQGRTIIFDISGDIYLSTTLNINKPNLTIAGQTAPGSGICLRDYRTNIDASNLIIRHIRFRPSEIGGDGDALSIKSGHNIIIDHCSASWSSDEVLSTSNNPIDSITIQWCYIYEGLNWAYHYENGELQDHSMGSLLTTTQDSAIFSIHHCLYAHNRTRNPKPTTTNAGDLLFFDFRNNVIYDWGDKAGYSSEDSTHMVDMNYIGNYLIAGQSTLVNSRTNAFKAESPNITIFQEGNKIDPNINNTFDGTDTGWNMFSGPYKVKSSIYNLPEINTESADSALIHILNMGGAFYWQRDSSDNRLIKGVFEGSGNIIDSIQQIGGYKSLPIVNRPAGYDTDNDGMPDYWELQNNLNPNDAGDATGDINNDGYTNLENFLNDAANVLKSSSTKIINTEKSVFCISPNPCSDYTTLTTNKINHKLILKAFDINGRNVWQQTVYPESNEIKLDFRNLQKGSYILKINADTQSSVVKLLKQ